MERHGLFGALRLEELGTGVLPHEDTRSGPKADRLALIEETAANFSPIFMLYRDPTGEVEAAISRAKAQEPQAGEETSGDSQTPLPPAVEQFLGELGNLGNPGNETT